jgi:hypothetical protein
MKEITEYLAKKSHKLLSPMHTDLFAQLLSPKSKKNVGILLSERVLGMSLDVIPQLHCQFPADLAFTKEQDDIDDPKEFDYDYFLFITRYNINQTKNPNVRLYYKPEDEIFVEKAEL